MFNNEETAECFSTEKSSVTNLSQAIIQQNSKSDSKISKQEDCAKSVTTNQKLSRTPRNERACVTRSCLSERKESKKEQISGSKNGSNHMRIYPPRRKTESAKPSRMSKSPTRITDNGNDSMVDFTPVLKGSTRKSNRNSRKSFAGANTPINNKTKLSPGDEKYPRVQKTIQKTGKLSSEKRIMLRRSIRANKSNGNLTDYLQNNDSYAESNSRNLTESSKISPIRSSRKPKLSTSKNEYSIEVNKSDHCESSSDSEVEFNCFPKNPSHDVSEFDFKYLNIESKNSDTSVVPTCSLKVENDNKNEKLSNYESDSNKAEVESDSESEDLSCEKINKTSTSYRDKCKNKVKRNNKLQNSLKTEIEPKKSTNVVYTSESTQRASNSAVQSDSKGELDSVKMEICNQYTSDSECQFNTIEMKEITGKKIKPKRLSKRTSTTLACTSKCTNSDRDSKGEINLIKTEISNGYNSDSENQFNTIEIKEIAGKKSKPNRSSTNSVYTSKNIQADSKSELNSCCEDNTNRASRSKFASKNMEVLIEIGNKIEPAINIDYKLNINLVKNKNCEDENKLIGKEVADYPNVAVETCKSQMENSDVSKGRKRWTVLKGEEARRSFQCLMKGQLGLEENNKESKRDSGLLKPRRSIRKRWSDELRKTSSMINISIGAENDSLLYNTTIEKNEPHCSETSVRSRRSRSSPKTKDESPRSPPKKKISMGYSATTHSPTAQPSNCIEDSTNMQKQNEEVTFEMEKSVNDIDLLKSVSMGPTSGSRCSRSANKVSKTFVATPHVQKSKLTTSNSTQKKERRETFELEDSVNDIQLLKDISLKPPVTTRRSRSLTDTLDSPSPDRVSKTYRATPYLRKSKPGTSGCSDATLKLERRVTFELEDSVNDIQLLKDISSKPSVSTRCTRSSTDTLDIPAADRVSKTHGATPYLQKSKPGTAESSDATRKIKRRATFELEDSVNDIQLLKDISSKPSVSTRCSRSSTDTLDASAPGRVSKSYRATPYVRKSKPGTSGCSDATWKLEKRATFELDDSVNDIQLLKDISLKPSVSTRLSRSLTETLDSPAPNRVSKSYRSTPYVRKSKPGTSGSTDATQKLKRRATFELEDSVNDIQLLKDISLKPSVTTRRSRSLTDTLDTPTPNRASKSYRATPRVRKSKPGTSGCSGAASITSLKPLTTSRRSKSLTDSLNIPAPNRVSKKYKATPHVEKSRISVNDCADSTKQNVKGDTFEMEDTVDGVSLLQSSAAESSVNYRRSRSLAGTSDTPGPDRVSKKYSATPHVRKSVPSIPLDSTLEMEDSIDDINMMESNVAESSISYSNLQVPGSILKRRGTYEVDESITDVSVLRSLSESSLLSEAGVDFLHDDSANYNTNKRVRFENVTVRKILKNSNKLNLEGTEEVQPIATKGNTTSKKVSFKKSLGAGKSVSFDQSLFSPPSSSSTPKISSKNTNLLKQVLTKETKTNLFGRRRSRNADEITGKVSRIKMPNFAKIHQRATDRLENIAQMTERKAERAKLLLSGQRPTASSSYLSNCNSTTKENSVKNSHRHLNFDMSQPSASKGFLKIAKNSAMKPKNVEENKCFSKEPFGNTKIPVSTDNQPGNPRCGFIKVAVPEKLRKRVATKMPERSQTTHYGFKIKNIAAPEAKTEQIKAVATKTKPQEDKREERKFVLKGVRANRRFDLLMKMRNK